jgi:PAS domain-containing protein
MTSPKPQAAKSSRNGPASTPTPESADDLTALLNPMALQYALLRSANLSSIATDPDGVIRIFNVGAEQMLRWKAVDVVNKITPADMSDPAELVARANALSVELGTPVKPGFEALVCKASRGIDDTYEMTYVRKDGSRLPTLVSVTAVRDARDSLIGFLLIGTENSARRLEQLAGLITMCAWCKRIRNELNTWQSVEQYLGEQAGVQFSHGMCPTCEAVAISDEAPSLAY